MRSLVLLTRDPIPSQLAGLEPGWALGPSPSAPEFTEGTSGAWLDFFGVVRAWEDGHDGCGGHRTPPGGTDPAGYPISAIDYEAHEEMAVHQIRRILSDLGDKYPVSAMLVIHRIGPVAVGEASLLVRILSGHREEALRCCAEFIDQLKTWVPIWKNPIRRT